MATRGSGCLRSLLASCCHAQQRGLRHAPVQPCLFQAGFPAATQLSGLHHRHQPRHWGCGVVTSAHAQAGSPAATALEVAQESSTQGFIELPTAEESPNLERIRHSVSAALCDYCAAVAGLCSVWHLIAICAAVPALGTEQQWLESCWETSLLLPEHLPPVHSNPCCFCSRPASQSCYHFVVNRLLFHAVCSRDGHGSAEAVPRQSGGQG